MWTVLVLIGAFLVGLCLCYYFLTWILFANLEIKKPRWLALFSATFALSVTLFAFYSIDLLQLESFEYFSVVTLVFELMRVMHC